MGASSSLFRVAVPLVATGAAIAATGGAAAPALAPALASGAGFGAGGGSLLTAGNLAMGASLAGTAMQGYGAYRGASDQASVDDYNARVMDADARLTERNTAAQMEMKTRETRRVLARQRALFGISGFTPTGSLAGVAQDSAEAGVLDALAIRYGGQTEATKLRNRGKVQRTRADQTRTTGYLAAGTSLLAGAASTADYWRR